ncbi:MAG: tRNA cyclic N6-threonylcarbamoyladenosine(37) synthase TcdA [Gammaproteobacteria bacterium]|nr:tRNA cyclic N6-threonylcarbamoyladenosine(37) synthase TcdA [Gammaproteobacteria bacterium]
MTDPRFGGIDRLYGQGTAATLATKHVAIVGLGGVGSWIAEALARTGVGALSVFDLDDVCVTNINRQLMATTASVGQNKAAALALRLRDINPALNALPVEDFVTSKNVAQHLDQRFDLVIDAIDSVIAKVHIIAHCKRQRIPVITVGGAGAQIDPLQIKQTDLNRTWNDPLLAKIRSLLRRDFGYSSNPKRSYGVPAIYSTEQPRYPQPDGSVSQTKPDLNDTKMNCASGFGASTMVTASFGMITAAKAVEMLLKQSS